MHFGSIYTTGFLGSEPTTRKRTNDAYTCYSIQRVEISVFIRKDPLRGTHYLAIGKGVLECECLGEHWISGELVDTEGNPYDHPMNDPGTITEGSVANGKFKLHYSQSKECCFPCAIYYTGQGGPGSFIGWVFNDSCKCEKGDPSEVNFRETGPWNGEETMESLETLVERSFKELANCKECPGTGIVY
jgi:hypothetical protein